MLDPTVKSQLATYLAHLRRPIRITAWLDGSTASGQVRALLDDLAGASPLVTWAEDLGDGERRPSFGIHLPGEAPRVRFAGLPLGHELTSLVLALLHVGGHPPKESAETLAAVRALEGDLRFETFFSQSCQSCPGVVQALSTLAALTPRVSHVAIEGARFREEAEARGVMAVPTVFLNGEPFATGRMDLAEILSRFDRAAASREAERLAQRGVFDVLVVGGGPAGAAAAIYAARKGIATGVVAERFGGQVLDTVGIENFISVSATEGPKLAAALEAHVADYPVDVMERERAKRLVVGDDHVEVELESGPVLRSRSVILATGARWRDMNVPGEREYRTRGVTYCPHCDGPLFAGKRVAVIGGGNSGVEAAIDLAGVVAHVTLLEYAAELKADDVLTRKLRSLPNVEVITLAETVEVVGDGAKVIGLRYRDRESGELRSLDLEGVFVQIGLVPNTEWLRDAIELTAHGEIVVDAKGRTSAPGVFAAGDATTVPFKQIVIAAGDGAKAALGAFEHLIRSSAPRAATAA